jgi:hypothetical protein
MAFPTDKFRPTISAAMVHRITVMSHTTSVLALSGARGGAGIATDPVSSSEKKMPRTAHFKHRQKMKRTVITSSHPLNRTVFASILALLPVAGHTTGPSIVDDRCSGIEYRLETSLDEPDSKDFPWWDGRITRRLAGHAFLNAGDFRSAKLYASPPLPGLWDIELTHTPEGAKKYVTVGNGDRDLQFSIVVGGRIVQSFTFPPPQKDISGDGTSAGSFPKKVAEQLLHEIREAIKTCSGK